jgi:hypothetical protein
LEPWEKVLVDTETYPQTVHGYLACTDCHGGVQSSEKEVAHTDLIARPSGGNPNADTNCHVDQPASVGGGLFDGHLFVCTSPMPCTPVPDRR